MKILDAKVDWSFGFANDPTFRVLVDRIPPNDELIYEQKGTLYYSYNDGYVNFYHYSSPGDGYGGHKFSLKMKDGSIKELVGPWSSREGCMNEAGFIPCVHCAITDEEEVWNKGYTFYSGSMSLIKAIDAARIANVYLLMKISGKGFLKELSGEQSLIVGNTDEIGEFIFIPSISPHIIDKPKDGEKNEHRGGFKPYKATLVYDCENDKIYSNILIEKYLKNKRYYMDIDDLPKTDGV